MYTMPNDYTEACDWVAEMRAELARAVIAQAEKE